MSCLVCFLLLFVFCCFLFLVSNCLFYVCVRREGRGGGGVALFNLWVL